MRKLYLALVATLVGHILLHLSLSQPSISRETQAAIDAVKTGGTVDMVSGDTFAIIWIDKQITPHADTATTRQLLKELLLTAKEFEEENESIVSIRKLNNEEIGLGN